ncbi:hypothetical protein DP44_4625 [Burkholderia pseudomallei]|nr:hypothetical protein DP44_4625 [Burkholderia pseudomallei]KGX54778.1 hypothetical protein Y025_4280 [Burkholderia pseudomallei TSV32]
MRRIEALVLNCNHLGAAPMWRRGRTCDEKPAGGGFRFVTRVGSGAARRRAAACPRLSPGAIERGYPIRSMLRSRRHTESAVSRTPQPVKENPWHFRCTTSRFPR